MRNVSGRNHGLSLIFVILLGWFIPGAGYWLLKEYTRAIIVFVVIALTFCAGVYVGSIGVIDPAAGTPGITGHFNPWFAAQILNSPLVLIIAGATASGAYPVYGKPAEIGQLYTSISGLLNLLCIINSIYLAHASQLKKERR